MSKKVSLKATIPPRFDIDKDILKRGVMVLTTMVLGFLMDTRGYV
jgi:hypothetical protein